MEAGHLYKVGDAYFKNCPDRSEPADEEESRSSRIYCCAGFDPGAGVYWLVPLLTESELNRARQIFEGILDRYGYCDYIVFKNSLTGAGDENVFFLQHMIPILPEYVDEEVCDCLGRPVRAEDDLLETLQKEVSRVLRDG